jgi:hypothetical protein
VLSDEHGQKQGRSGTATPRHWCMVKSLQDLVVLWRRQVEQDPWSRAVSMKQWFSLLNDFICPLPHRRKALAMQPQAPFSCKKYEEKPPTMTNINQLGRCIPGPRRRIRILVSLGKYPREKRVERNPELGLRSYAGGRHARPGVALSHTDAKRWAPNLQQDVTKVWRA